MTEQNGMKKPTLSELPRITDRMTFLYLEHCCINREDGAITAKDLEGTVYIPAATVNVLLLGPGTDITHRVMELIGDAGITVIWVGEQGVRYYAHGRALSSSTALLEKQAKLASNERSHLQVAKKMYQMRFGDAEDISKATLQQLRGFEGSRMRKIYREQAKKHHVEWHGRQYDIHDFNAGTPVNQALSAANVCLYGLATAVIVALGCSPALGFVHVHEEFSFAYDIADLYKAEISIPLAFELAKENVPDLPNVVRRSMRDIFRSTHLLERMVKDIRYLFDVDDTNELPPALWDNHHDFVDFGVSYGKDTSTS